jgi:hypothetical protein
VFKGSGYSIKARRLIITLPKPGCQDVKQLFRGFSATRKGIRKSNLEFGYEEGFVLERGGYGKNILKGR